MTPWFKRRSQLPRKMPMMERDILTEFKLALKAAKTSAEKNDVLLRYLEPLPPDLPPSTGLSTEIADALRSAHPLSHAGQALKSATDGPPTSLAP